MSLESVAMTDIVLNMFIFFFISFSLLYTFNPNREQKLEVKLAESTNTSAMKDESQAYITITSKGQIYLGKDPVTKDELRSRLTAMRKKKPFLSAVLRPDKGVRFMDFVSVLDILNELKISNINVAALSKQQASSAG